MLKGSFTKSFLVIFGLIFVSVSISFAQSTPEKKNDRDVKTPEQERSSTKKNARPADDKEKTKTFAAETPVYFYEFSRPGFQFSKVLIEHDENGKGRITFLKKGFEEDITDPLELSSSTLEKLKTHWEALNFLDSTENYQFEKDYSHLGTIKIMMKKKGRERTAEFNWTQQENAKALMDEYRKISNQHIWMFDINVSRENQPLESPRMMNNLDMLLRRNEIADASQMIPFLKGLSDDERIPLISRNHATRLVKKIEKQIEKQKDKN